MSTSGRCNEPCGGWMGCFMGDVIGSLSFTTEDGEYVGRIEFRQEEEGDEFRFIVGSHVVLAVGEEMVYAGDCLSVGEAARGLLRMFNMLADHMESVRGQCAHIDRGDRMDPG